MVCIYDERLVSFQLPIKVDKDFVGAIRCCSILLIHSAGVLNFTSYFCIKVGITEVLEMCSYL